VEEYTVPGQWILDPMCGVGTTLVEGLSHYRNVYGIELEERFAKVARMNGNYLIHQARMDTFLGETPKTEFYVWEGYAQEVLLHMMELEYEFDLITFSPPYEGIDYTYRAASSRYKGQPDEYRGFDTSVIDAKDRQVKRYYSEDPYNIANMKNGDYWAAMSCIYNKLYELGDRMIVIVKNQIKKHKERDFAQETVDNVNQTGWRFHWTHIAEISNPSYFENVRRKLYPKADKVLGEHVLVFER